ncbi:selenocysteine-specific translation elongation factor [candidate division KSB1 bacterium]
MLSKPLPGKSPDMETPVPTLILGTAGHIDHGKTQLVKVLTGIDTDRLQEEKERGMSIDLGFAFMDLPGGEGGRLGIVDVPGHERFLKNMLSGAAGIDLFLLVVAADDGVMPQTAEHAEVLDLLGIHHGIVAVTKIDLVDPPRLKSVLMELSSWLKNFPFGISGTVPVSTVTGEGVDDLKALILRTARELPTPGHGPRFRLPVDRVFSIKGHGLVVTGSAKDGSATVEDKLVVVPPGWEAVVRGIEVHGQKVNSVRAGQRTALNLAGLDRLNVERGMELAAPGASTAVNSIEVRLRLLKGANKPLERYDNGRLHMGAWEGSVKLILLDRQTLQPGDSALARLKLSSPAAAARGDRFVLRSAHSPRVIGGGTVLRTRGLKVGGTKAEFLDRLGRLDSDNPQTVAEVVFHDSEYHPLSLSQAAAELNLSEDNLKPLIHQLREAGILIPAPGTDSWLHAHRLGEIETVIAESLRKFHGNNPYQAGAGFENFIKLLEGRVPDPPLRWVVETMVKDGEINLQSGHLSSPDFAVPLTDKEIDLRQKIESLFLKRGFRPPIMDDLKECAEGRDDILRRLLDLMVQEGTVIPLKGDIRLHRRTYDELKEVVTEAIEKDGSLAVSYLRDRLDISRKFSIAYLEYLDRIHFTRRVGDHRVLYKAP